MRVCNGCGGIVGRDCFNPVECEWISQQIQSQDNYNSGYRQAQIDAHEQAMREDYYNQFKPEDVPIPDTRTQQYYHNLMRKY